ncbi:MAG: hypothetical protein V1889_03470 [archaeon]
MMAEKKMTVKEIDKKIMDLKIELLRNPTKKGKIKREIARLLTMGNRENRELKMKTLTKLEDAKK